MIIKLFKRLINSLYRPGKEYGEYPAGYFTIYGPGKLVIKDFTSIARGTTFILTDNHLSNRFSMYPFGFTPRTWGWCEPEDRSGEVTVGHDAWIGAGVIINKGVTIGDGALVCAGSVVFHDVKPYSVVSGNPARFMFYRFNPETIALLEDLKWWDWPEEKIKQNLHVLKSGDLGKLLALKDRD